MGITFVEKGDRSRVRPHARTALVLAGGAISGGAFKLGGLIALDSLLVNRTVSDFDIYVGLSAGAFLAAPLAAGIPAPELFRAIDGRSERIGYFGPLDFYRPNWRELIARPLQLGVDSLRLLPHVTAALLRQLGPERADLVDRARQFVDAPSTHTAEELLLPFFQQVAQASPLGPGLSYLPSGAFTTEGIERFLRENFKRNHVPNHFRLLKLERGKSLYVGATNLNTAEEVVFGPDEDWSVSISEAVQASTAIPGFYCPARINGRDYLDANVRRTANISLAVLHGASLIIAYSPFRPYVNYEVDRLLNRDRSISDMGIVTIVNQAFRTLLHTRLMLGVEKLRNDSEFKGDLILIEPTETDARFFHANPLAFWGRVEAAHHGFVTVKEDIERSFERVERILASYGIEASLERLQSGVEQMRERDRSSILAVLEQRLQDAGSILSPRPPLRVVAGAR
jgi:predicted acylesterase/phospholipase RssA